MQKVSFYIDKNNPHKNNTVPIVANVTIDGKKIRKIIYRIKPRYWNKKNQKVSPPRAHEPDNNHKHINDIIERIKTNVRTCLKHYESEDLPTDPEELRHDIKEILNGTSFNGGIKMKTFWDAFDEYIKEGKGRKAKKTHTTINTTYNKLKAYEKSRNVILTFNSINDGFYDDLSSYILNELDHHYNNFAVTIKRIKAFLNWSFEKGYHKNLKYKSKKWSTPEKEGTVIHLTWNELQKLIKYPYEKEVHRKARDFFCFGCLTGQRYSDIIKLTKDNVSNNEIKIIQAKTKKEVIVPMYPGVQTIIDRYPEQYRLLPKFSNQKINIYIKEACKIAEINTPTEYKEFPKHRTEIKTAPKYKLIGTHTARKTFVCLAYEKGLTIPDIKEITGIEQEKTLKRYLIISTENKRGKLINAFGSL